MVQFSELWQTKWRWQPCRNRWDSVFPIVQSSISSLIGIFVQQGKTAFQLCEENISHHRHLRAENGWIFPTERGGEWSRNNCTLGLGEEFFNTSLHLVLESLCGWKFNRYICINGSLNCQLVVVWSGCSHARKLISSVLGWEWLGKKKR